MAIKYKSVNVGLVFMAFLLSAGCMVVPGAHIDSSVGAKSNEVGLLDKILGEPFDEVDDLSGKITTHLITPSLLSNLRSVEPSAQINVELQKKMDSYSYVIGVGDVLNIIVWDHPELTIPAGQFRSAGESGSVVHHDGTIFYPYIGSLKVAGVTVGEARKMIASSLARFIESPQVEVSVAAFLSQRAFVTGAVTSPLAVPITNVPTTLIDALNASGGLSSDADWRSVTLTSVTELGTRKRNLDLYALYQMGDMSQNLLLTHNDIIHVPRNDALKVFVMGDVIKPQTQRIDRNGLSLAEAINNVGGINEMTSDASGIFVLRASDEADMVADVFQLDASQAGMLILSTQFELKPLDIVYVTSAPVARWNKVISSILPTINSAYFANRILNASE